jgi:hypothetical protein
MTNRDLLKILRAFQKIDSNLNSVFIGYKEVGGETTAQKCVVFGVNKKLTRNQLASMATVAYPKEVLGLPTDVQVTPPLEGTRSTIAAQSPYIRSDKRGWYGSAGPVVQNSNGVLCQLTNRHVAPDLGDVFRLNGNEFGTVIDVAEADALLDISVIELASPSMPDSELGVYATEASLGDVVWHNAGLSGKNYGSVGGVGISIINDPILGRTETQFFRYIGLDDELITKHGDSGSGVYSDGYGKTSCAGVICGINMRWTYAVPILPILSSMNLEWKRPVNYRQECNRKDLRIKALEQRLSGLHDQLHKQDKAFDEIKDSIAYAISSMSQETQAKLGLHS